jgi:hypothetical protein
MDARAGNKTHAGQGRRQSAMRLSRNKQSKPKSTAVLDSYYRQAKEQGIKKGAPGQVLAELGLLRADAHKVLVDHFKELGESQKTAHQNAVLHLEKEFDPVRRKMVP